MSERLLPVSTFKVFLLFLQRICINCFILIACLRVNTLDGDRQTASPYRYGIAKIRRFSTQSAIQPLN